MFIYKENNGDSVTRGIRRGRKEVISGSNLRLERDKETSDKGYVNNPTSEANKLNLGIPEFDVKIDAGKQVVITHDQRIPDKNTKA